MKLCGAPGGDVRSPTKIRCGLDFYLNGRKIERFYVSLLHEKDIYSFAGPVGMRLYLAGQTGKGGARFGETA